MNLHFVCTGNVFRSRLAECYARYLLKNHPQIKITSSGVSADVAGDGPIAWYALRIIKNNALLDFLSPRWIQTSQELLDTQDLIIFMTDSHLEICRQQYNYSQTNFEVWAIEDVGPNLSDLEIIAFSEKQFAHIKDKVKQLVNGLLIK